MLWSTCSFPQRCARNQFTPCVAGLRHRTARTSRFFFGYCSKNSHKNSMFSMPLLTSGMPVLHCCCSEHLTCGLFQRLPWGTHPRQRRCAMNVFSEVYIARLRGPLSTWDTTCTFQQETLHSENDAMMQCCPNAVCLRPRDHPQRDPGAPIKKQVLLLMPVICPLTTDGIPANLGSSKRPTISRSTCPIGTLSVVWPTTRCICSRTKASIGQH